MAALLPSVPTLWCVRWDGFRSVRFAETLSTSPANCLQEHPAQNFLVSHFPSFAVQVDEMVDPHQYRLSWVIWIGGSHAQRILKGRLKLTKTYFLTVKPNDLLV